MSGRGWVVAAVLLCVGCGGASREQLTKQRQAAGGDDCDGIMPGELPESRTVVVPGPPDHLCGDVTVDQLGNVAAGNDVESGRSQVWYVYSRDGVVIGAFRTDSLPMPQPSGFQGLRLEPLALPSQGRWRLYHWNPDGSVMSTVSAGGTEECGDYLMRVWTGGSQAYVDCSQYYSSVSLSRFDSSGQLVGGGRIATGRDAGMGVAVDLNGLNLLSRFTPDRNLFARWVDLNINPVSDEFLLMTVPPGWVSRVGRLIGGGLVYQLDNHWAVMVPSGKAESLPAPDWLAPYSNYDIEIVRGGRAYALIPKWPEPDRRTISLYSASGNHCGDVTFPLPDVTIGIDGTAIVSTGGDACTITWWPAVLP